MINWGLMKFVVLIVVFCFLFASVQAVSYLPGRYDVTANTQFRCRLNGGEWWIQRYFSHNRHWSGVERCFYGCDYATKKCYSSTARVYRKQMDSINSFIYNLRFTPSWRSNVVKPVYYGRLVIRSSLRSFG